MHNAHKHEHRQTQQHAHPCVQLLHCSAVRVENLRCVFVCTLRVGSGAGLGQTIAFQICTCTSAIVVCVFMSLFSPYLIKIVCLC